jgi:hypothetical protein
LQQRVHHEFIARGPRQPACIFETKIGRELQRALLRKNEKALS